MSVLRFHLCNLPSIVQVYYQLFNYSDDIYQGQLHRATSCRENGQSVLLLHSHAEECAAEAVQVRGPQEPSGWTCSFRGSVSTHSGVTINHPLGFLTRFSVVFISFGCHSSPIKCSFSSLYVSTTMASHTLHSQGRTGPQVSLKLTMHRSIIQKKAALMHPCSSVRG